MLTFCSESATLTTGSHTYCSLAKLVNKDLQNRFNLDCFTAECLRVEFDVVVSIWLEA